MGISCRRRGEREMGDIVLNGTDSGVTVVPNTFIDRYLAEADGEYVKIYLLLWRYFGDRKSVTIPQLADLLDDTEKDVLRALRYWSKKGLLELTGGKEEITGIRFLPFEKEDRYEDRADEKQSRSRESEPTVLKPVGAKASKARTLNSERRRQLTVDEDFGQLVRVVDKYLGGTLGHTGTDVLGYLYGELGMSADLLEYLVETCLEAGHRSIRYIEQVALDWHEKGIATPEDAKERAEVSRKEYYQVLKAFGVAGRRPAPEEKKVMDIWFYDYGFQLDIVLEACNRTIRAIHKPSFEYAGGILADWKKKGVKSRGDIDTLDATFARGREDKSRNAHPGEKAAARPNGFHNFDQEGYDYDAIVRQLNG